MKFSEQWLREWVDLKLDTQALAEQLTMAGLEVDGVEPAAADFDQVVVGEVLSVEKHPQADKLNVCQVGVGSDAPLSIVCGAKNVRAGMKVPAALVGANLPNGLKIKKAKLRGVESSGMLCSTAELGLSESAEGLMDLPADAPVGTSVRDYLQLDDQIIEVDFTPNRGDCLGVAGMARELCALNENAKPTFPEFKAVPPSIDDVFGVDVQSPGDCPVYLGRVIRGLNPLAQTPMWMQERLRRAGNRSLGPLVDVTNYVLLEMGQPMHAFDLAKLKGKVVVRRAKAAEKLKLLDESEVALEEDILVIADEDKAHAFAGVMGGHDSAVGDDTQDLFLECAFFTPDTIRGRARQFGMQTDSSYRFERGVDFSQQHQAMERATQLILDICGGSSGPIVDATSKQHLPKRAAIALRKARIVRVLGIELKEETIQGILHRLGMIIESMPSGWRVIPPSHRFDIAIEADLIEEIGRVYGYNRIPTVLPVGDLNIAPRPEAKVSLGQLRSMMVDRGYHEAITYSFVDPHIQGIVDPERDGIELENPISSEMSVMRTTLWSSLLKTLSHNLARQQNRVRVFEIGRRFYRENDERHQESVLAGVVYGSANAKHWDSTQVGADFFDVKSDVEAILGLTHSAGDFIFKKDIHPALHPGRSASIIRTGESIGWIGALHPKVQKDLELPAPAMVFEILLDKYRQGRVPKFAPISKFPSIQRDLALVLDDSTPAHDVVSLALQTGGENLRSVDVFDVYHGKGIPEGKKSLAISLTIQDDRQTLTDDMVEHLIQGVLNSLEKTLGATLRD